MIRIGVIGYGYWGPNIVRNLHGLDSTRAEMICDKSPAALARARKAYPEYSGRVGSRMKYLRSPDIDAVAVITPVWTHYELAKSGSGKREARFRREAIHVEFGRKPKN